ncbi:hypothetical protein G7Z17_g2894 [Cylindrodendrum hubeiense]|uniref:non-specific serine/threonine protein kinase n=1 Tax=Cylindrodendrum hubeiense TaxID=595255 RepID=A0A9P5HM98_9HYPO|nr:hypothetical protein G7Z17_g2894 [Cylindrodendrum hubeiense]
MGSRVTEQNSTTVFAQAPERNQDKFGPTAISNQKRCSQLATDFFKDSVKRARERNQRQDEIEKRIREPTANQPRREQIWCAAGRKEGRYLRFLRTKDKPENYQTIKIIGRGAFGEVKLVQKNVDGQIYAMKSLIKTDMLQRHQLAHVRSERDILAEVESPWIVKLFTTFQDAQFLYMLMEFLPGGDLMTMLIKYEIFSENVTRFYIAETILAIEAVHALGFIHRYDMHDYVMDFGLSTGFRRLHDNSYYKQLLQGEPAPSDRNSLAMDQINLTVSNRSQINEWRRSRRSLAFSQVGTPDYTAPEIFTGRGYSYSCDWWSLGAIIFECLVGWPPFYSQEPLATPWKIVNWKKSLYFPDDIQLSLEAENVIQRIKAPFQPTLTSNIDTSYFPMEDISQTESDSLLTAHVPHMALQGAPPQQEESLEMSLPFIGYTFKRFDNNFR